MRAVKIHNLQVKETAFLQSRIVRISNTLKNKQNEGKNFKNFDEIRSSRNTGEFACEQDMCVMPQNVITIAAKCNNIDAKCNKVFNAKCKNFSTQNVRTFLTHNVITLKSVSMRGPGSGDTCHPLNFFGGS